MAPATRRSSGLGSHANGPSNLDHILEHFNQFKRKHIVQNRDIIKTNALAQLRIKELEDKVLALEAERAACKLDVIRMQSRLDRAESAARAVRKGWQLVGAGIAALTAVEGFDLLTRDDHNGGDARHGMQTHPSAYERPSMHITLDRNALPSGVARNVARAPEKGLNDLLEETSAELSTGSAHRSQLHLDDEATREDGNDDDDDGDDDDDEDEDDDGDPVSFSVDDDTIKMNGSPDVSGPAMQQHTPTITLTNAGQASAGSVTMDRRLNRMTSIDSLSSFADDEEVELSTDDDETRDTTVVAKRPASAAAEQRLSAQNSATAKGAGRKRKSPSSPGNASSRASSVTSTPDKEVRARPGRRRGYDAGEDEQDEDDGTMSASQSEDDSYLPSSRESRHSRRSSMRDRKSVNYALPKLNTKMRKPDPVDLVPAARGEERRRRGSEDASDDGAVCSSGELAQRDDRGVKNDNATSSAGDGPDDSEHRTAEAARIRTLKGKHEVASAGNLRDLRQKHQRQQEYAARRDGVPAVLDDTLSSSSREQSETAGEEARNESPRRRSSRKSLHERTSSSSLPASEPPDAHDGVEREPDAASSLERVKTTSEAKTLSNGSHAVPSTPKWRATQASSVGAARQLPSVTGTPIPRPTVRAAGGNAQGIKALSVAGRMQRAPSSTTTSAQQNHQRAAMGSNGGKASVVAATNGTSASTNVLGSSARANASQPPQRSVSAGHVPQSTPAANINGSSHHSPTLAGNAGDPTKRNSLHAALTSNDAFATLSASLAGVRTNGTSSSD